MIILIRLAVGLLGATGMLACGAVSEDGTQTASSNASTTTMDATVFAVPTYPADFFAGGNHPCAGVEVRRLEIEFSLENGMVDSVIGKILGSPSGTAVEVVFPFGYSGRDDGAAARIVSADGQIHFKSGDTLSDVPVCMFGGDYLVSGPFAVVLSP